MNPRILLLICLNLLVVFPSKSQLVAKKIENTDSIDFSCIDEIHEQIYLHLERWSVVVGERLYFKGYLLSKSPSTRNISKILYIELLDSHNKIKVFARSTIDSGICKSSILIPDTLKTGLYKIVAYTNLMRNFPANSYIGSSVIIVGMKNDPVDNTGGNGKPDSLNKNIQAVQNPEQNFLSKSGQNLVIEAASYKQVYGHREKVVINFDIRDKNQVPVKGDFSVSVSEKLPDPYSEMNNDISFVNSVLASGVVNVNENYNLSKKELVQNYKEYLKWLEYAKSHIINFPYKAETKGFLLEGRLFEKSSHKAEAGKIIFLSTTDSLAHLNYCTTDSDGKFIFGLDNRFDNQKLILNLNVRNNSKEYYYILDNKQILDSICTGASLNMDNFMYDFLQKSKRIAVINEVYNKSSNSKFNPSRKKEKYPFYGKADYTVKLSDFIELDDFNDICSNLLPGVKFKKKKDVYSMCIRNLAANQNYTDDNCLVLLNNIPFYDFEYLSTLGSNQIDRIDVCYRHIAYGNLDFYGVLSIFTRDKVMISNRRALIYDNKMEYLSEPDTTLNRSEIGNEGMFPDFNQVLLWNPDLKFDVGKAKIEFVTSDLNSEYSVDIEGLTESGIPVSKKIIFKVQ